MRDVADAILLRDRVTAALGDRYLVGEEVGRGGMAVVYAAQDVRLQRPVALKVLPPELAFRGDVRERFVREAQTAARLNHPHIVPIYAVHEDGGLVSFAMALITGESLAARIGGDPRPSFEFVATVLEQVADALAYAHACGVVHRDVKPDNVLIDRLSGRALVTDFGIARAAESGSRLTQTGVAVGTPAFMSPEQATGEREIDGRSDLYSLGVVGYLMLAGRLPFEANTTPAMLLKHVSEAPPPIRTARADAPRVLVDILEKCLAKRPQDRWDNALLMRDALRRALRDGSVRSPASGSELRAVCVELRPEARPNGEGHERSLRDITDRFGHRAEDWTPRRIAEPEPSPLSNRAPSALPPVPMLPALPANAPKEMVREWEKASKQAVKDWRVAVRDQRRGARAETADRDRPPPPRSDAELVASFRRTLWRSAALTLPKPARIAAAAKAFTRHAKWAAAFAAATFGTFATAAGTGKDGFLVMAAVAGAATTASALLLTRDWLRLRAFGVRAREAWNGAWMEIAAASDDRPHAERVREQLALVAGESTLQSRYGETLHNAVDDHVTICEVTVKLADADRALVPEVTPTANALLERIGALAAGLERLERDLPTDAGSQLDQRLSTVRDEPGTTPDHERRLVLLTRQRESLDELLARRETMHRQLDSASMAMRALRLDIVKLRTMGVGAAIDDVTSATQEARALSRDMGRVLEAADELRRI